MVAVDMNGYVVKKRRGNQSQLSAALLTRRRRLFIFAAPQTFARLSRFIVVVDLCCRGGGRGREAGGETQVKAALAARLRDFAERANLAAGPVNLSPSLDPHSQDIPPFRLTFSTTNQDVNLDGGSSIQYDDEGSSSGGGGEDSDSFTGGFTDGCAPRRRWPNRLNVLPRPVIRNSFAPPLLLLIHLPRRPSRRPHRRPLPNRSPRRGHLLTVHHPRQVRRRPLHRAHLAP